MSVLCHIADDLKPFERRFLPSFSNDTQKRVLGVLFTFISRMYTTLYYSCTIIESLTLCLSSDFCCKQHIGRAIRGHWGVLATRYCSYSPCQLLQPLPFPPGTCQEVVVECGV